MEEVFTGLTLSDFEQVWAEFLRAGYFARLLATTCIAAVTKLSSVLSVDHAGLHANSAGNVQLDDWRASEPGLHNRIYNLTLGEARACFYILRAMDVCHYLPDHNAREFG